MPSFIKIGGQVLEIWGNKTHRDIHLSLLGRIMSSVLIFTWNPLFLQILQLHNSLPKRGSHFSPFLSLWNKRSLNNVSQSTQFHIQLILYWFKINGVDFCGDAYLSTSSICYLHCLPKYMELTLHFQLQLWNIW